MVVVDHKGREERVKVMVLELMVGWGYLVVEMDFKERMKRKLKEVKMMVMLEVEIRVMEVVL